MSENPPVPPHRVLPPDSYLPSHGDVRFAVRHYALTLDYKVATNHLAGTAVIDAEALTDLTEVALDLYGLHVSRVRVEKAKEMLRDPNHRVSEVAYQTGFQSLSHFNRCFKRITGQSPTACRQELHTA